MVFGHFYGECGGEGCVEIYKIEDGKLFEDTLDQYPHSNLVYQGVWVELPQAKYDLVRDILDEVPDQLLQEPEHVLGQPDAGDWGGIYVQVSEPLSGDDYWLLDKHEGHMIEAYNDFVDKIETKIELINQ